METVIPVVQVDPAVLAREGYTEVFDQNEFGEVTLRNDSGGFEVFAIRDSFAGWCIPTLCGKVLEFCRSAEIAEDDGDGDEAGYDDEPEYDELAEFEAGVENGDWTTDDGCTFYRRGRGGNELVLDATDMTDAQAKRAAGRIMRAEGFWPNVWYVSDHGNVSIFTF